MWKDINVTHKELKNLIILPKIVDYIYLRLAIVAMR